QILRLIADADRAAAGTPGTEGRVAIRSEPKPLPETEPILGYLEREQDGRRVRTHTPTEYPAQLMHDFQATESVARPAAYLIPAGSGEVLATLQRHGIDVQELRE